jgi:hypothetical protein
MKAEDKRIIAAKKHKKHKRRQRAEEGFTAAGTESREKRAPGPRRRREFLARSSRG